MELLKPVIMAVLFAMKVLRSMLYLMIRATSWLVLQSTVSPLEMGACISVVDVNFHLWPLQKADCFQIALAASSLFIAVCDWHVPRVIPYHSDICRFLSAICMQALFPYSTTLTCLAFLYPTFGKRGRSIPTSAPESGIGAPEHVSTSAGDNISLDDVIAKLKAADNEDKRGEEIGGSDYAARFQRSGSTGSPQKHGKSLGGGPKREGRWQI